MENKTYQVKTSVLLRVGLTKQIEKCYSEKTISFSCAANWIDYALKMKNETIGDIYECIFAHVRNGDPRINSITDREGNPMGNHLLLFHNEKDNSVLMRFEPAILMPALCFYSFDIERIRNSIGREFLQIVFDMDNYCVDMKYERENSSYLLITNPVGLIEDLKKSIPNAIRDNKCRVTDERFYGEFSPDNAIVCRDVDYNKYKEDTIFFCNQTMREEIFWKLPKYERQSELRMVIPHINFKQIYDPNKEYDRKKNTLDVYLPHFREYAEVVYANEWHTLIFSDFDNHGGFRLALSKYRADELI